MYAHTVDTIFNIKIFYTYLYKHLLKIITNYNYYIKRIYKLPSIITKLITIFHIPG